MSIQTNNGPGHGSEPNKSKDSDVWADLAVSSHIGRAEGPEQRVFTVNKIEDGQIVILDDMQALANVLQVSLQRKFPETSVQTIIHKKESATELAEKLLQMHREKPIAVFISDFDLNDNVTGGAVFMELRRLLATEKNAKATEQEIRATPFPFRVALMSGRLSSEAAQEFGVELYHYKTDPLQRFFSAIADLFQ